MKSNTEIVLLLVVGSSFFVAGQTSSTGDIWKVDLKQGSIESPITNEVDGKNHYAFKSIPFAQPPVGDLRFKDPVPAGSWTGVKNGSAMTPVCPQVDIMSFMSGTFQATGNEDCLYLEVYVPKKNASNYPVMVWIHGGGFLAGSARDYESTHLMSKDVVVVLIQYRLGTLGFFTTGDSFGRGNYGLKDQVMALKWVRDNIRSFGGDPDRITIFGESAGAMSVHYHILSPMSKGLFHRAIAQSGTATFPMIWNHDHRQTAATLGQILECPDTNPDDLDSQALYDCLGKVSSDKMVMAAYAFTKFMGSFPQPIMPTIDGEFLPEHPIQMLKKGNYNKVNFMTGITKDEAAFIVRQMMPNEASREELASNFSTIGPYFLSFYKEPHASPEYLARRMFAHYVGDFKVSEGTADAVVKMITDFWFAVPLDIAGLMHSRDAPFGYKTYLYEFRYLGENSFLDSPNITVGKNWVSHADDLQYLFGSHFLAPLSKPMDVFMRDDIIIPLWTNFARTGNPTPDMSLGFKWSALSGSDLEYLIIQPSPYMRNFTRHEELEFMTNLPMDQNMRLYPERFVDESDEEM